MLCREEETASLITMALTATIDAEGERVWRAVVDPAERLLWDDRILGRIEGPCSIRRSGHSSGRPLGRPLGHPRGPGTAHRPLRTTAWRIRLTDIPLVMREEIHREEPGLRLVGRISIGSMRFDEVVTVHEERDASGRRTRLGMKLVAGNSIAVFGELLSRTEVQRIVIGYVDVTLRQIRKHCESPPT